MKYLPKICFFFRWIKEDEWNGFKPVSINSILVTSVKCCVCCERSKPSPHLPPSVCGSKETPNSKHSAVDLKKQNTMKTKRNKDYIDGHF